MNLEQVEKDIRKWYLQNATHEDRASKNWFILSLSSAYKEKTLKICNFLDSVDNHFNAINNVTFNCTSWERVEEKLNEFLGS